MKKNTKILLICLAVPLLVGALSGWITKDGMEAYKLLNKPPLSPPGWLFPVVWTILYILMGIASYLVVVSKQTENKMESLFLYGLQLAVNFLWPVFFFQCQWYFFSFLWLVLLWCLILAAARYFYTVDERAGYLMVPYLLWVTFAGYLNLFISFMN